jgi:hypothetical protein
MPDSLLKITGRSSYLSIYVYCMNCVEEMMRYLQQGSNYKRNKLSTKNSGNTKVRKFADLLKKLSIRVNVLHDRTRVSRIRIRKFLTLKICSRVCVQVLAPFVEYPFLRYRTQVFGIPVSNK